MAEGQHIADAGVAAALQVEPPGPFNRSFSVLGATAILLLGVLAEICTTEVGKLRRLLA